jgi:hypothetical protein
MGANLGYAKQCAEEKSVGKGAPPPEKCCHLMYHIGTYRIILAKAMECGTGIFSNFEKRRPAEGKLKISKNPMFLRFLNLRLHNNFLSSVLIDDVTWGLGKIYAIG